MQEKFTEVKNVFFVSCRDDECKRVFTCPLDIKGVTNETLLPCGHPVGYHYSSEGGINRTYREGALEDVSYALQDLESAINRLKEGE